MRGAVFAVVGYIQGALKSRNILDAAYIAVGKLDWETMKAIRFVLAVAPEFVSGFAENDFSGIVRVYQDTQVTAHL
jgi:hypothetical protein